MVGDQQTLLFSFGIGAMLALAIYNLLLFFAYDDNSYISLFFMHLFWGLELGHTIIPALTEHTLYPSLRYSFMLVGLIFGLQLTRQYLKIADISQRMDHLLRILIALGLMFIALLPFFEARDRIMSGFLALVLLVPTIAAVLAAWQKKPLAYLFLAALLPFLFLSVVPALLNDISDGFFSEPDGEYINYVQGTGIILTILFLALMKVSRIRQLRREHELVKAADLSKSNFLYAMSHEMRSPLHVLIGINHLLQDSLSVEQQKDYLKKMDLAAKNLLAISSNTLDLSQLDSDPEKFALKVYPFDPAQLFSEINDLFSVLAQEKGLSLVVAPLSKNFPVLLGDRERLLQILFNLLDNAIKYTEAGEVSLACHLLDQDGQYATLDFHVHDTGVGISAAQQNDLFRPFYRANLQSAKPQSGYGLGLPICYSLVKKMGGLLQVESTSGKGSHFHFSLELPLALDQESLQDKGTKESIADGMPLPLQNIHILLVDDDEMNRIIGAKILRNRGAVVDVAENGMNAIVKAAQKTFDLILMDISMPGLDGYETVRRLRVQKDKALPIVALTAHSSEQEKERCLAAGMDDYLAKPFQLDVMERVLLQQVQR